jgi:alcohol dehydrogenase YqhD (iron-dependent ADH family)
MEKVVPKNMDICKKLKILEEANVDFCEFGGIKPNPIVDDVQKAVEFCKQNNIDFIIGVGGGSVIDSAKIIALAYANNAEPWDIMTDKYICTKSIPIVAVLTMAATGTEMNPFAVLQNHNTHEKIGFYSELIYPAQSYLDPNLTLTVPKDQTAYGIADIVAHSLEAFFACGQAHLSDQLVGGLLREIFEVAPLLIKNLENYEYRARIMWASTVALNGTLYGGRKSSGDWGVHSIGHVVSYLFDTPQGQHFLLLFLPG